MMSETENIYSIEESGERGENRKLFEGNTLVWEGKLEELMPIIEKYQAEYNVLVDFMERHTIDTSNVGLALEVIIQCPFEPITTVKIFNTLVDLLNFIPPSVNLEQKRKFLNGFLHLFNKSNREINSQTIDLSKIFFGV